MAARKSRNWVRRIRWLHRWTIDSKREGKEWLIDSFGYGYHLEAVFDGKFPERPKGRWKYDFKETESKDEMK